MGQHAREVGRLFGQHGIAHEPDVTRLTPHGWKEHFADKVRERREAVLGRILAGS